MSRAQQPLFLMITRPEHGHWRAELQRTLAPFGEVKMVQQESIERVMDLDYLAIIIDAAAIEEDVSLSVSRISAKVPEARLTVATTPPKHQLAREALQALAWMGMTSISWRHVIANHASTIRDLVRSVQDRLNKEFDTEARSDVDDGLSEIFELAGMIEGYPVTAPLSSETDVGSVQINALFRHRIDTLLQDARYQHVIPSFGLSLDHSVMVRGDSDWLTKIVDVLVDNAVGAMENSDEKVLSVLSDNVRGSVEIRIGDTGCGVPDHLKSLLFQKRIEKPRGSKGLGMGLLIAQFIAHAHGGEILLGPSGRNGTTMILRLPRDGE